MTSKSETSKFADQHGRRQFLTACAGVAAGILVRPARARVESSTPRSLAFHHLHTGEKITRTYWADGAFVREGLTAINHLLRDHRTDEVYPIDPDLLHLLHALRCTVDSRKPFDVISGYRSPKTNAMLRKQSSGVARRSLHMQGKAIDIRLPGCDLSRLRKAALSLRAGGVGYYARSNFIHVDTGRFRTW